ncbi:M23 family metallopeptidase [Anthocerotibacter panamensis]|uniref:M23 family metallopeptidase n=1 Tax=Anthocerotibacter panamensis TaxID=2857077 RepID=UPI001C401FD5|nr:M23 family metallopeptidase [Anthocerotibacter panamensis]
MAFRVGFDSFVARTLPSIQKSPHSKHLLRIPILVWACLLGMLQQPYAWAIPEVEPEDANPVNVQLLDYNPEISPAGGESFSAEEVASARRLASLDDRFRSANNPISGRGYMWPIRGAILSPFGPRGGRIHPGLDIDGPMGAKVVAARAGLVVTAGPKYSGYGNMVDILHEDGTMTRYGHATRVIVHVGQVVAQGEPIMTLGCTGRCTGPHVHFEVRLAGHAVNPLPYLR